MTTRADLYAEAIAIKAGIELAADVPGQDLDALAERLALIPQLLTPPPAGTRWVLTTEPAGTGATRED